MERARFPLGSSWSGPITVCLAAVRQSGELTPHRRRLPRITSANSVSQRLSLTKRCKAPVIGGDTFGQFEKELPKSSFVVPATY